MDNRIENKNIKSTGRRKFFNWIYMGGLLTAIAPGLFTANFRNRSNTTKSESALSVKIHPGSVKRVKGK